MAALRGVVFTDIRDCPLKFFVVPVKDWFAPDNQAGNLIDELGILETFWPSSNLYIPKNRDGYGYY